MDVVTELKNIKKSFQDVTILDQVNLSLEHSRIYSLVGASGSGKSTLLRIISGQESACSGMIHHSFKYKSKIPISYAPQQGPLFSWLTIYENLKICSHEESTQEREEQIRFLLEKSGLTNFKHLYPGQISGGMIQKINIIRSFLNKSELVLMDEPFAHLDFYQREILQNFTLSMKSDHNPALLFVTHNLQEAICIADTLFVMSKKQKRILTSFSIPPHDATFPYTAVYKDLYLQISEIIKNDQEE